RQRAVKTKWIADGQHLLTHEDIFRITQRDWHQLFFTRCINLDDCQVVVWIFTNLFSLVLLSVGQRHVELLRSLNDMVVSQDVAFLVKNRAGSNSGAFSRIDLEPTLDVSGRRRGDVDHAGAHGLVNFRVVLFIGGDRRISDVSDGFGFTRAVINLRADYTA